MKKVLLTLVTVALVLSCVFAFVACGKTEVKDVEIDNVYGNVMPKASEVGADIKAIPDKNDGKSMLINALDNYYKCDFVAARLTGQVDTEVLGIMVSQMVDNIRVRENGNQFMYNNSWTKDGAFPNIRLMDNNYYDASTGKTYLISTAGDNVVFPEGVMTAKKWDKSDSFDSIEKFMEVNPNNPTKLNMYTLNDETIKEVTAPEQKETTETKQKYYTMKVTCDAAKAFKDYVPVMEYMLKQQGFTGIFDNERMSLTIDVEIWENGLFKQFTANENFGLKIQLGIFKLDSKLTLPSTVLFNYDKTVDPMSSFYKDGKFVAESNLAK